MSARKLRFGMIGGGRGAFIGAVHRIAAIMDGQAELVAGAFSSDAERSSASGADLMLDPMRVYGTYDEMAAAEAQMSAERRLDFIVIVTPNHQHFGPAKRFLEAGFNVIMDKPLALNLAEARELREIVRRSRKVFVLTHNYCGYPMIRQARRLVLDGTLGEIRKVIAEYSQGWLTTAIENEGQKQASWRTDPARSGASGCLADIGSHAHQLLRHVTGLRIEALCADLTTFVPGRRLEDDGNVLLRFEGGAKGVFHTSQIAVGEENNLSLRVYGTLSSFEWRQQSPEDLIVRYASQPQQLWRRANAYITPDAQRFTRLPPGHPEGYLEAFGSLYKEAMRAIAAEIEGQPLPADLDFPGIEDGVEGLQFIDASLRSSAAGGVWTSLT